MNKLAIVTGGSRGIGRAITEKLISMGYDVYFTYLNNNDAALELEKIYEGKCRGFKVNSESQQEIISFCQTVLSERTPEVLINNVGINNDNLFISQTLDDFWKVFNLNFGSVINYCKPIITSMLQIRKGHIINISSVAAVKPKPGNSAYGSSKAAIERFSKTLALEFARFGVKVNCISPGFVQTELLSEFLEKNGKAEFYKSIPARKTLETTDISNMVASLVEGTIETTGSVFYIGNGENITG